jgi:S-adenosylmethionine/arginine decarboxylase-like enzyme
LVVVLVSEATMSFTSYTSLISIHSAPTWVLATFLLMTVGEVASAIGFLAVLLALRSRLAPTSTPTTSEDWDT